MAIGGRSTTGRSREHVVPARFMQPRIMLIVATVLLVAFGLLMVYSASSVEALTSTGDAAYYFKRQVLTTAVGVVAAIVLAKTDYHLWSQHLLLVIWAIAIALLLFTAATGVATKGAVRWIEIAGISIQPSEFSKIVVVLAAANIAQHFFEEHDYSSSKMLLYLAFGVVLPLGLILIQPDKGTTIILVVTLLVMAYLAGVPLRYIMLVLGLGGAFLLALILGDDYSRSRVLTALNPQADPYGAGYQLNQGLYAFGNGGLFGVGIGLSRQKYSYLPEAHNDFIFAVIGEECGLVGTLAVVGLFALFIWAGMRIARYASDLSGRLIAAGCTTLIGFQFLVNVCGILGITPMTGKPLPFISYGGSSIMSCLMLVGFIISVSRASNLPETVHDRRRSQLGVAPTSPSTSQNQGGVPSMRPRGLTLVSGGNTSRNRIDLGRGAYDRLRPSRSSRNSSNNRSSRFDR
ncbi:MAG TPA: putative lipid II flippase FtsW [Candidatus Coprovicinus avistercoris]|uniref:Probable peptidoglycan glycosyltransferase FtsW n=1 Tax=Candidatus Coprovicinus avistercoris TaxID=2840754 RepID=A0A9D1HW68_9ACTN|nr:putative lipid II flippase FtsW [Candidatus Coprovicinus avistercoris]